MSNIFFLFKESNFENKGKFISLQKLFLFLRYSNFRTLDFMTSSNASEWIRNILLNNIGRKHSWNMAGLCNITKEKKTLWPVFYGWGSAVSRLQSHYCETVYFLPLRPQEFLVFILSNWKDGRLSWPWSHPVVLKPGHLDLESNLITIPLRHCSIFIRKYYKNCPEN